MTVVVFILNIQPMGNSGYLVGGLEHEFYDFPYVGNVIIPTDFHIFQRGRYTTNQIFKLKQYFNEYLNGLNIADISIIVCYQYLSMAKCTKQQTKCRYLRFNMNGIIMTC